MDWLLAVGQVRAGAVPQLLVWEAAMTALGQAKEDQQQSQRVSLERQAQEVAHQVGADLAAGVDLQALAVEHLGWVVADLAAAGARMEAEAEGSHCWARARVLARAAPLAASRVGKGVACQAGENQ